MNSTKKKREGPKRDFDLTDPEILGFFIGAAAYKFHYAEEFDRKGLSKSVQFELLGLIEGTMLEVEKRVNSLTSLDPPERPKKMDDVYKGFDPVKVRDLKELRFYHWRSCLKGLWITSLSLTVIWVFYPAPRELKRLIKRDHILDEPEAIRKK